VSELVPSQAQPTRQPGTEPVVPVVAAVIVGCDGRILMAQRPRGKVYAGYWEFPGGKIEPNETAQAALTRELNEELGITVERSYPWITRYYTYEHASVALHFFRVVRFRGELRAREGQAFRWQNLSAIDVQPILPANGPILAALRLPAEYAITNAHEMGEARFMRALERRLKADLRLVQIREPQMTMESLERFSSAVIEMAHAHGARVLVNENLALAERCAADGIHLKAAQLGAVRERPAFPLVGASCHDAPELRLAAALGADLVVLGPVAPTLTHPGSATMGWSAFEHLAHGYELPVYALGGMRMDDLETAWTHGAHGIGMQRGAWS